jgi:acetyl esterase/lipase
MRFRAIAVLLTAMSTTASAAERREIPLWPGTAPGETGEIGPERETTTAKDRLVAGKPVIRIGNISKPVMTVYRPAKEKDTGAAVLVFPGGGYNILAYDLEGTEVCEWLNSIGVTGVLVKYRVPARPGTPRGTAPLQDAQRAIRTVRGRAAEWGIKPERIGVLGFSAGAHLAVSASARFEHPSYPPVDEADKTSARPDFAVVVYPGYLALKEADDRVPQEILPTAATPPMILIQTADDNVRVENSLSYFKALKEAKVPAEMHLFATGGHGYGLRPTADPVTKWPSLVAAWMQNLGILR